MSNLPPPPGQQPPPPDGGWQPPPQGWQPGQYQQPPQKKGRGVVGVLVGVGACLLIAIIAVVVGAALLADSVDEAVSENERSDGVSQGGASRDASGDVEITECGASDDSLGFGEATVVITNNSSGRSDYFITVVWESEDGSTRHADTPLFARQIEPGQSTTETANALKEVPDDAVCRVTEVQRTASN